MDTDVENLKTVRGADVEEAKVSTQVLSIFKDDIALKICRDLICFPVAIWCALGTYDTIIAKHYPQYMFVVEKFPPSMETIPYAVLVFLFGNIGINMWARK